MFSKKSTFAVAIFLGLSFVLLFSFQNCGKVKFSSEQPSVLVLCSYGSPAIDVSPSTNVAPSDTVTFSISPAQESGTSINWIFSDGATFTGAPIERTFSASGSYSVQAILSRSGCPDSSTITTNITIGNAPVVPILVGPINGTVGVQLNFHLVGVPSEWANQTTNWSSNGGNLSKTQGVNGTNNSAVMNDPNVPAFISYANPGTYVVSAIVPSEESSIEPKSVIICGQNQIFQNGQCVDVTCTNPFNNQSVALNTIIASYPTASGTCTNPCQSVASTCSANGASTTGIFSPAVSNYATCTDIPGHGSNTVQIGNQCFPVICTPNSTTSNGCPTITNGTSTKTCNSTGTAWGACTSSCNSPYVITSESVQPNITCSCPSGTSSLNGQCVSNSCSQTKPSCEESGICNLTQGIPTQVSQPWRLGANSCTISCTHGSSANSTSTNCSCPDGTSLVKGVCKVQINGGGGGICYMVNISNGGNDVTCVPEILLPSSDGKYYCDCAIQGIPNCTSNHYLGMKCPCPPGKSLKGSNYCQ